MEEVLWYLRAAARSHDTCSCTVIGLIICVLCAGGDLFVVVVVVAACRRRPFVYVSCALALVCKDSTTTETTTT